MAPSVTGCCSPKFGAKAGTGARAGAGNGWRTAGRLLAGVGLTINCYNNISIIFIIIKKSRKRRHFYWSCDGDVVRAAISKEVLARTFWYGHYGSRHFYGSFVMGAAIFTEVLLWEPPFLRKFWYGRGDRKRHFTEVIFCMYYRKRYFNRNGSIAQCITITFNSPQWRPTRRVLPSSCRCNDRGGCPGIHCSGIICMIKFILCLTSRAW